MHVKGRFCEIVGDFGLREIESSIKNDNFRYQVNESAKRHMDEFVPFLSGILAPSAKVTTEGVEYNTPYAYRMWDGFVWDYQKGQVTDIPYNYTKDFHPNARSQWHKELEEGGSKFEAFNADISAIIKKHIKGGGKS